MLSPTKTKGKLMAPDSPFAPVIGAGRRAAWRRTLLRRIAALLILAAGLALLILRPGADGVPAAAPTPSASATEEAGGVGIPGLDLPGGGDDPVPTAPATPRTSALGATALPEDRVGVVLPVPAALAVRLRPGDTVDLYAAGARKPMARDAEVVDVTRPGEGSGTDPAIGASPGGEASVFLAIDSADVEHVSAGQRASSAGSPMLVVLASRASDQARRIP